MVRNCRLNIGMHLVVPTLVSARPVTKWQTANSRRATTATRCNVMTPTVATPRCGDVAARTPAITGTQRPLRIPQPQCKQQAPTMHRCSNAHTRRPATRMGGRHVTAQPDKQSTSSAIQTPEFNKSQEPVDRRGAEWLLRQTYAPMMQPMLFRI
jgi:hypothetical protein